MIIGFERRRKRARDESRIVLKARIRDFRPTGVNGIVAGQEETALEGLSEGSGRERRKAAWHAFARPASHRISLNSRCYSDVGIFKKEQSDSNYSDG